MTYLVPLWKFVNGNDPCCCDAAKVWLRFDPERASAFTVNPALSQIPEQVKEGLYDRRVRSGGEKS